jgi:hypothetical protein
MTARIPEIRECDDETKKVINTVPIKSEIKGNTAYAP